MKRMLMILVIVMSGLATAGPQDAPLISPQDLKKEIPSTGFILAFPEGMSIPLRLSLSGELAKAQSEPITVKFKRELFVYIPVEAGEEPMFSWDRVSWKEWKNMFTGSLGMGLKEPDTTLKLDLVLYVRKP